MSSDDKMLSVVLNANTRMGARFYDQQGRQITPMDMERLRELLSEAYVAGLTYGAAQGEAYVKKMLGRVEFMDGVWLSGQ
jgi:hypothetical protein